MTNPKNPSGPDPLRVKIDATFEEAAKRMLGKPKPPEGWPGKPPKSATKKRPKKG